MNKFLILIVFATLFIETSCKNAPFATTFETNQIDSATKLNEQKIYHLKRIAENADFNYSDLDDIDGYALESPVNNCMQVFEPVRGQYLYYQFRSTYIAKSSRIDSPSISDFHDILIVKTDKKKNIIDAYQYTLEWAEPPLQYDLFKSSAKNITLVDNLDIAALKFLRTLSGNEHYNVMQEQGRIKLR